ncbi:NAD(P)H-dependent oxidoreductase [Georgenia sp. SUBG003]|uniref:NAD(P)H-dependent oxidoreductase n=1 Tax=Georgenia sp. SUBG003 TaxID=1497974 RepID=UPI003AB5EB98
MVPGTGGHLGGGAEDDELAHAASVPHVPAPGPVTPVREEVGGGRRSTDVSGRGPADVQPVRGGSRRAPGERCRRHGRQRRAPRRGPRDRQRHADRIPTGALREVLEKVTGADGLVLVTPLFTTTYSGLFKSFVDVLDKDSLTDMPVLLGATGGTPRHSLALEYSMRPLLTYLRADVVTTSVFAATDDWAGEARHRQTPAARRASRPHGDREHRRSAC